MESWENKTLGDKLNSLHNLPAGYSPNLSAKWEIIEAGLPVAEKRRVIPLFFRWSVAAAVLLTIGLLWMNASEKKAKDLDAENAITKRHPLQKQLPESPKVLSDSEGSLRSQSSHQTAAIPADENLKQPNQLTYQQSWKTATIPVREDTNRGNENNINTAANLSSPADSIAPKTTQQTALAVALEEKSRPAKKKIYQRDFNDGVLVMDTGFAPATRQHFSVQVKPFSRKTTDDGEASAHRLQLKQIL